MSATVRRLTWEDVKDLPENGASRTELVDGELVVSPAASSRHQRICTKLGVEIGLFLRSRNLGEFFSSPVHVILDQHVHYEPDLCFVAAERVSIIDENYVSGPPNLIIEVISESNRSHDTTVKFNDYQRYGVKEYWLVDPRENHIRVFLLEGSAYRALGIYAPGDRVQSRIFAGLDLDPAAVLSE
ncbi:MAG: Uma2 family endonuclease [Bryobacterales bacterium]